MSVTGVEFTLVDGNFNHKHSKTRLMAIQGLTNE